MSEDLDLAVLLAGLDECGVDYVIGGSVAVAAHGVPDVAPADLDVIPATGPSNLTGLATALRGLGAEAGIDYGEWQVDEMGERIWVQDGRPRPPERRDAADPSSFDHWFGTAHGSIDIVPRAAGTYRELRPRAVRRMVAGSERWVASIQDLLVAMTRVRRAKDRGRVDSLRASALASNGTASGVGFVGFRTDRFDDMVTLFRDRIGLEVIHQAPGATWFRLGTDAELHVYADTDPDHRFFTSGPVVGLRVADVEATRATLEADGLEMLTDIERTDLAAWCHFRAPDGTVLEIIGPA